MPTAVIEWQVSAGGYATTALFDDGAIGDTTTYEQLTGTIAGLTLANGLMGRYNYGELVDPLSWSFTYAVYSETPTGLFPVTYAVQKSFNGTIWSAIDGGTLGDIGLSSTAITGTVTGLLPGSAQYYRLVLYCDESFTAASGYYRISDFRVFLTDPTPCTPPTAPVIVATPGLNGIIPQVVITGQ